MYKIILGLISMQIITILWIVFFAKDYFVGEPRVTEMRQATGQFSFISPLLECGVDIVYNNTRKIEREVNNYIQKSLHDKKADNISYFARVLNNGGTFGYDFDREYTPASLVKLPLAMAVLKNTSFELLSETVTLGEDIEVLPRNIGTEKTQLGGTYSVRELIENMLIHSDNIATEALFMLLGEDIINTVYRDLNLRPIDFDNIESVEISPRHYAGFFRILYNGSYIGQRRAEYLLKTLSRSDFDAGIAGPIPGFIRISNKFGERSYTDSPEKQLHDCGIVYSHTSPYVLCIMTSGTDYQDLSQIIQDISRIIYTQLR